MTVPDTGQPAEPGRRRFSHPVLWIALVTLVPLAAAVALSPLLRPRLREAMRNECLDAYAQAATAAESLAVDTLVPVRSRGRQVRDQWTCGDLRRRGELAR